MLPKAIRGLPGDSETVGPFLLSQTAEKAIFGDISANLLFAGRLAKRVVEHQQVLVGGIIDDR
jgi:hypothetical protein